MSAAHLGRRLSDRWRAARRLLRRVRARHGELGWRNSALHAARRLTGKRAGSPEPSPAEWLRGETRPAPGAVLDVIYAVGYWFGEPKRYRVFNMA
jgi:hypothetical protein